MISSLRADSQDIPYFIFDDFSSKETRRWLEENSARFGYKVIGLEKHTKKSSPNYRTTLILAQKMARILRSLNRTYLPVRKQYSGSINWQKS